MFEKNAVNYFEKGDIGECPTCNTKLNIEIYQTPIRDNFQIYCKKCNKYEYYTGVTKKES